MTSAENVGQVSTFCTSVKRDAFISAETKKIEEKLKAIETAEQERKASEHGIKDGVEQLNDGVYENFSLLLNGCKAIFKNALIVSKPLQCTIEAWSKEKARAASKGKATIWAEKPKYVYGYYVHLEIIIKTKDGSHSLNLLYQVCKGAFDPLLTWPFNNKLRLSVLGANGKDMPEVIRLSGTSAFPGDERPTRTKIGQ